jgi:hypothetical protein
VKNRAKCRLCSSIIESHFMGDVVTCKCGEITVYDGAALRMECRNIENFLRVDDLGNEIVVTYVDKQPDSQEDEPIHKELEGIGKSDLIDFLDHKVKQFANLPDHVKLSHVTCVDLYDFMLDIVNILKKG